jgi:hypothetical protein
MTSSNNQSENAFNDACRQILDEDPEAIGVAFKWLDCGCSLICGVSAKGAPLGLLVHVSGQPKKKGRKPPICLKCKRDNGMERVVWQGIHWPGDESELPDKKLRLAIGRKVFGPNYSE